ncbi:Nn.00g024660.m01.CDS01 [Neocucurbitaria sp. VM-36]
MPILNDRHYRKRDIKELSIPGVIASLPDETLLREFSALYETTMAYVKKFYTTGPVESRGASQIMLEQTGASTLLPWPQTLELLGDATTRPGILTMCIARTMLSRSLLLLLGTNNSPGSTFLPPELLDCFQSFCAGKSAATLDGREPKPMNFALLARWKQISASLLDSVYVDDAFSPFDGRTVNIERAMEDLGPLLAIYAIPDDAGRGKGARLSELRNVLRKGAGFAFTLFGQPCLWRFDWYGNREIEAAEGQIEPRNVQVFEKSVGSSATRRFKLSLAEVVIWPRLLRITDENGCTTFGKGRGSVVGDKRYLENVL